VRYTVITSLDLLSELTILGFKFPSLDPETEKLLWRRKADLELTLRQIETITGWSSSSPLSSFLSQLVETSAPLEPQKAEAKEKSQSKSKIPLRSKQLQPLAAYLKGASSAQVAQIEMIKRVFEMMDIDSDGFLSATDIKSYFLSIGRPSTDSIIRKWIRDRDVDQDGVVSLEEYVASFAYQLDPMSRQPSMDPTVSPVATAFGALRLACSPLELTNAVNAALSYGQRILDSPSTKEFWKIPVLESDFQNKIGHIFGGVKLMLALGFVLEDNSQFLALNNQGLPWESVPIDIRKSLSRALDELQFHHGSLSEPSVSNIAAVSSAIGQYGESPSKVNDWVIAVETIVNILANILTHPTDSKYFTINPVNPNFHRRVGKLPGAIEMLISFGFREEEGGVLVLPLNSNLYDLSARKLELEVGLDLLRKRVTPEHPPRSEEPEASGDKQKSNPKSNRNVKKVESEKMKVVDELKAEKMKRQKAETSLHQQAHMIKELQQVVSTLQMKEDSRLTLRQGLTIARMAPGEKEALGVESKEIGRDDSSFGRSRKPIEKRQRTSSAPPSRLEGKTLSETTVAPASTSLSSSANFGDTHLEVVSNDSFKVGMKVLIGSGASAEIRTIVRLGSLIIDMPLSSSHPVGAPIFGLAPSERNSKILEAKMMREFFHGILTEEIIPSVVAEGVARDSSLILNKLYSQRSVLRHISVLYPLGYCSAGTRKDSLSMSVSPRTGNILSTRADGLYALDHSITIVGIFNLFHDLASEHDSISLQDFTKSIELNGPHYHFFISVARSLNFENPTQLFCFYCDDESNPSHLSWGSYLKMIQSDLILESPSMSRAMRSYESGISDELHMIFCRIFDLADIDGDELLTLIDLRRIFGGLDGISPLFSDLANSFPYSLESDHPKPVIDFQTFVTVRLNYSKLKRTLPGGLFLEGRRIMRKCFLELSEPDSSLVDIHTLLSYSPQNLLGAFHVSSGLKIEDMLRTMTTASLQDLEDKIFGGCLLSQQFWMPQRNYLLESDVARVVHAYFDSSGTRVFAFTEVGEVHVIEISTNQTLFKQRVVWSESLQVRPIESGAKFYQWLDNYPESRLRGEVESTSSRLARFLFSQPGVISPLAVDEDGGLLVVNCGVTCGSLCILDEMSLRRIYRIRVPVKISSALKEKVQQILDDRAPVSPLSVEESVGLVISVSLCARRSLILCKVGFSPDIHCLSLFTGDILCTLFGHSHPISFVSFPSSLAFLITGSVDTTVRVWTIDNLHQLAAAESRIVRSVNPSKSGLRLLSRDLIAALSLKPVWRKAMVVGFNNGTEVLSEPPSSPLAYEVEVVFEDASAKCYANRSLLRDPRESQLSPNGPLWGNSDLVFSLGMAVVTYEIDPETATLACARRLGLPTNSLQTYGSWISMMESMLDCSQATLDLIRRAGLSPSQSVTLSSFMRIIFDSSQTLTPSNSLHRKCDRILHSGHSAAVVGAHYSQSSKLLVTVDSIGWCCLWDLCGNRTSLSLLTTVPSLIVGSHPFCLSGRLHLKDCLPNDGVSSEVFNVISVHGLICPKKMVTSYPLTPAQLTAAYRLDCKYSFEDVQTRGFIYVMKDLTFKCLQAASFIPSLVTFHSSDHFLSSALLLATDQNLFQEIFALRSSLLRIIYAVSCSHSSLDSLAKDLSTYGVLQRGYSKTPSERLEIVCFENFSSLHPELNTGDRMKKKLVQSSKSGLVVEVIFPSDLMVALDNSSDVIRVRQADVQMIFNRAHSSRDKFSVGSKVTIRCEACLEINPFDKIVFMQVERGETHRLHSGVVSLGLGRCTFSSSPTKLIRTVVSDALSKQLRISFERQQESAICALMNDLRLQHLRQIAWSISQSQLATHLFRPLLEDKHPIKELGGESCLSLTGLCAHESFNLFVKLLGLARWFSQTKQIDPSHPLTQHFISVLNADLSDLLEMDPKRVSRLYSNFLLRDGVTADEVFTKVYGIAAKEWNVSPKTYHQFRKEVPIVLCRQDLTTLLTSGGLGAFSEKSDPIAQTATSLDLLSSSLTCRVETLLEYRGLANFLLHQHYFLKIIHRIREKLKSDEDEMLYRTKSTILGGLQSKSQILRETLTIRGLDSLVVSHSPWPAPPAPGQYSPASVKRYSDFFLPALIISADSMSLKEEPSVSFFCWDPAPTTEEGDLNFETVRLALRLYERRLADLLTRMSSPQFLIPLVKGVSFGSSFQTESGLNPTLLNWSERWISLDNLLRNIGHPLFHQQTLPFLRFLVCDLLTCVSQVHESGLILRSLSLRTIFLDGDEDWANTPSTSIRVLCTPTLCDNGSKQRDPVDGTIYQSYLKHELLHTTTLYKQRKFDDVCTDSVDFRDLGHLIFLLAFGVSPPHLEVPLTESGVASSLIGCLFSDLMGKQSAQDLVSSFGSPASEEGGIFSIIFISDLLSGRNSSKLRKFWSKLRLHGLSGDDARTGGFFESGLVALWERIALQVSSSVKLASDRSRIRSVLSSSLSGLSVDSLRNLFSEQFQLRLTAQELHLFVLSLFRCAEKEDSQSRRDHRPIEEMINPAVRYLFDLFDDFIFYESFQETIFLVTRCFLGAEEEKTSRSLNLSDLQKLSVFRSFDNSEREVVLPQLLPFLSGFSSSPSEYVEDMFVNPLRSCLTEILSMRRDDSQSAHALQGHLVIISSCLNCLEELLFIRTVAVNSFVNRKMTPVVELEKLSNLAETGVDIRWILEDAHRPILDLLIDLPVIPAIVVYISRFLVLDASKMDYPEVSLKYYSKRTVASDLSIGSKLLIRIVKFFEHCILCLSSLSRLLSNFSIPFSSTLDTQQKQSEVQDYLLEKSLVQRLYFSTVASLMMVEMGEEVPYLHGCRDSTLASSFDNLLSSTQPHATVVRWNPDISKMFEPLLRDLLGDDSKGNHSKVNSSGESLTTASNVVSALALGFSHGPASSTTASFISNNFIQSNRESDLDLLLDSLCGPEQPWWRFQLLRGPGYFACHSQIYNGLLSFYKPSKHPNKVNLLFASTVLNLLPNLTDESLSVLSATPSSISFEELAVEPSMWQIIQAILDTRVLSRLLNILLQADVTTKLSILKVCLRSLAYCSRLPKCWQMENPFRDLGNECSSLPWLVSLLQVVRDRTVQPSSELYLCGLKILQLMSRRSEWMRHWPSADVLPFLASARKKLRNIEDRKTIVDSTLSNLQLINGSLVAALLKHDLWSDLFPSKREATLEALFHESNDLSFGSTLNEQMKFADSLARWIHSATVTGATLISCGSDGTVDPEQFWSQVAAIGTHICHWLPSLTLPLEIEDRDKDRQTRAHISADVIVKQLQATETILLSSLAANGESSLGLIIGCLWTKSSKGIEGNATGLLVLLSQIETAPAMVEKFLSLRVEIQIMTTLCEILSATPTSSTLLLCEVGVVNSCCQFLRHCVTVMHKVVKRAGLHKEYLRFHSTLLASWRRVWGTLFSCGPDVHTMVLDNGILGTMVCDWLSDATVLAPPHLNSKATSHNPLESLLVRREVIHLLRALCLFKPQIERLLFQVTRHLLEGSVVPAELEKLRSEKSSRGSSAMRVSALHVVALLAELNIEEINLKFAVCPPVFFSPLTLSLYHSHTLYLFLSRWNSVRNAVYRQLCSRCQPSSGS
jgi:WD40 repeat protein